MNAKQFRELIVRPTLKFLDPEIPYSKSAEELLMLTWAVESDGGTFLAQIGGPALGVYQMEPMTKHNLLDLLEQKEWNKLQHKIASLLILPTEEQLPGNLYYATAMARLKYYSVEEPLPQDPKDIFALASYWKMYYNSLEGKGTVKKAMEKYRKYVRWTG